MEDRSQFALLAERRFGPFFGVQFLGAMNDNVFKQALVILLAYQTASFTTLSSDTLQNLAQALFVLPFFLFSATAGQLADKYEKSRLITVTVMRLDFSYLSAICPAVAEKRKNGSTKRACAMFCSVSEDSVVKLAVW